MPSIALGDKLEIDWTFGDWNSDVIQVNNIYSFTWTVYSSSGCVMSIYLLSDFDNEAVIRIDNWNVTAGITNVVSMNVIAPYMYLSVNNFAITPVDFWYSSLISFNDLFC